jgi:hypothetical protein
MRNHLPLIFGAIALGASLLGVNLIERYWSNNDARHTPLQARYPVPPVVLKIVKAEVEITERAAVPEYPTESTRARSDGQSEQQMRLEKTPQRLIQTKVPNFQEKLGDLRLHAPAPEEVMAPAALPPPPTVPFEAVEPNLRSLILPNRLVPLPTTRTVSSSAPSGRLIWRGRFPRNGTIEIVLDRSSNGFLEGSLPGYPVDVSVYPGSFKAGLITLYTADMKYARKVLEAPDVLNGRNKILYTWEPLYARDVMVVEAPGTQNNWKKLVLRSRAAKPSIIVAEWRMRKP